MKYLLNKLVKYNNSLAKVVSQLGSSGEILVMDVETFDLDKNNVSLSNLEVVEGSESTVEEFYDSLSNNYFYDETISELKLLDENRKTDKLMSMTMNEAINRNVYLSDLNEFDYDTFFHNVVKNHQQ